jgi:hypothetical protein
MKRIFLLGLAIGTLALSAVAQFPGGRMPQPPMIDPATGLPIPTKVDTGPRFDLNFPGGEPANLIEAIEKASKQRPNVVIHPECAALTIPGFRLRDVSAYQVFTTLNTLNQGTSDSGYWQRVNMEDAEIWTLLPQNKSGGGQFTGGFPIPISAPRPQPICKIFNLGPYLDKYTVEDITTSVQGAWDLMKLENIPSIKYHKDTKLLIVVGFVNELNVVADVLHQLDSNLESKEKSAKIPADSNKDAKPASKL